MNYQDPTLREKLAAEYVLGTLRGAARRRFQRLLRGDDRLRAAVSAWEARFATLLVSLTPVAPPARVWQAIAEQLIGAPARSSLWQRLSFWRPLGLTAGALAAALLVYVSIGVLTPIPVTLPSFAAVLQNDQSQSAWVVSTTASAGEIAVKTLQPQALAEDKAFELWLVPADGKPRSLGLIAQDGATRLKVAANLLPAFTPGTVLAVSLEPTGGSPTGSPTGPVLYHGKWQPLS